MLIRFFIIQSTLLGTLAFIIWAILMSPNIWPFALSLDTLVATAAGIILTAMFLLVVAWPFQIALRRRYSLLLRIFVGAISGPIEVWLGLLVLSSYPINLEWYVSRAWALHSVYTAVGTAFAIAWYFHLRSKGCSKPT